MTIPFQKIRQKALFGREGNLLADRQNTRLFDPALPGDQSDKRALSPAIQNTLFSAIANRGRGSMSSFDLARMKARTRNPMVREQRGGPRPKTTIETKRAIMGQRIADPLKRQHFLRALQNVRRPVVDVTGVPLSPQTFNPRTGQFDRRPPLEPR